MIENKNKKISVEIINEHIIDALQDKKAKGITLLDLRNLEDRPTDFFIICEGTSTTHVSSLSQNLLEEVKKSLGISPSHLEGTRNGLWVLTDYFYTVVHIFTKDTREFYQLDQLWGDAIIKEFES